MYNFTRVGENDLEGKVNGEDGLSQIYLLIFFAFHTVVNYNR